MTGKMFFKFFSRFKNKITLFTVDLDNSVTAFFHIGFLLADAYKDHDKNQHMKKIFDRCVTGFSVVALGVLWY